MNLIKMKCENCSANLEMDLDHLIAFCPYCGNKLMVNIADIQALLIEKEKTKQQELAAQIEHDKKWDDLKLEREQSKDSWKFNIFIIGLIILLMFLIPVIFSFGESLN